MYNSKKVEKKKTTTTNHKRTMLKYSKFTKAKTRSNQRALEGTAVGLVGFRERGAGTESIFAGLRESLNFSIIGPYGIE